jgi:endonuclease/exonuclease/phosphatase (EEP) superfamily protein YafD
MLKSAYNFVVVALTASLLAVTALPITDSQEWWIRILSFPRIQIFTATAGIVVLCLFLAPKLRTPALVVAVACLAFQGWKILPYTPIAPKEIRLAPPGDDQLLFMAANVLMENRNHGAVAEMIRREAPDLIFLMETDQTWIDALRSVFEGYETVLTQPQDNHYGLVFATNLEVVDVRLLDIGDADKPTLYAELKSREGHVFRFVGLHPPPPVPGQDTDIRDAKTAYAARFARKSGVPLVIMGDLNDAAWSHIAQRFKRIGGYLDPRIGRGPLSSFDATNPILRYPIDQFYMTPDVALVDLYRGERIGSDHFPMLATVRIDPELASGFNAEPEALEADDEAEVVKLIDAHGATLEVDIRER